MQFGNPDANYRAFGYQWPGQTSVKYLNCFTFNGFSPNSMTSFTFASKEGGIDDNLVTAEGLNLKVYYRFAGNAEISSSEATNNAGAYLGTLGKYAVKVTYHKAFDPEDATSYVTSDMALENGTGNSVTFGGKAGSHTLTVSAEAVSYWLDNGYGSVNLHFAGKEGQVLAFQVTNFSGKPAGNGTLTISDYVLTESMRSTGLKIEIFWRAFDNDNDKVDGMVFTVTPNPAADADDPTTWLVSGYSYEYDAENAKFTFDGNESADKPVFSGISLADIELSFDGLVVLPFAGIAGIDNGTSHFVPPLYLDNPIFSHSLIGKSLSNFRISSIEYLIGCSGSSFETRK